MAKSDFSFFTAVGTIVSVVKSENSNLYAFSLEINKQHYLKDFEEELELSALSTTIKGVVKLSRFSMVNPGSRIAVQGSFHFTNKGEAFLVAEDFLTIK